uniref:Putative product n=1 Tax=Xenopsylla cheopis TaxID=163159 RepID=A0A6M2DWZ2_XENCH
MKHAQMSLLTSRHLFHTILSIPIASEDFYFWSGIAFIYRKFLGHTPVLQICWYVIVSLNFFCLMFFNPLTTWTSVCCRYFLACLERYILLYSIRYRRFYSSSPSLLSFCF